MACSVADAAAAHRTGILERFGDEQREAECACRPEQRLPCDTRLNQRHRWRRPVLWRTVRKELIGLDKWHDRFYPKSSQMAYGHPTISGFGRAGRLHMVLWKYPQIL